MIAENRYIVTHVSPDWDAIGYAWLMQRFGGCESMYVRFVNTGRPDPDVLAGAYSVGDTGREYDPDSLRFDHHHLAGHEANATCAAMQAYQWLLAREATPALVAIRPLVELIYCGDTGKALAGAPESRALGIHALLSAWKARQASDELLLGRGYAVLDDLASVLLARQEAQIGLADYVVYRSTDGLVVALRDAPQGATAAAFELGARLVCFQSTMKLPDGTISHARGIQRGGEGADVHIGHVVESIIDAYSMGVGGHDMAIHAELSSWYRHEAGFFAGRGTAKAPDAAPPACDIVLIAGAIDAYWVR